MLDSGSSHNIMQPGIAAFLSPPIQHIDSFSVMVGNGATLQCEGLCPNVPLAVQQYKFQVPFYLLPNHGADVVLGVQWLQPIDPFMAHSPNHAVPS